MDEAHRAAVGVATSEARTAARWARLIAAGTGGVAALIPAFVPTAGADKHAESVKRAASAGVKIMCDSAEASAAEATEKANAVDMIANAAARDGVSGGESTPRTADEVVAEARQAADEARQAAAALHTAAKSRGVPQWRSYSDM